MNNQEAEENSIVLR